jgi:hypothetical protein
MIFSKDWVSKVSYRIIKYGLLAGAAVGFLILAVTSLLVRDIAYPMQNPRYFLAETAVVAFFNAVPLLYIGYMRRGRNLNDFIGFLVLFVKIALIHIGFQLSGVYTILLPRYA